MEQIGKVASQAVASSKNASRRHKLFKHPTGDARVLPDLTRTREGVEVRLRNIFALLALGQADWPLYLHGPVGTGKSRAALWFCDQTAESCYHTVETVMDAMRSTTRQNPPWDWPWSMHLAILDELGCHDKASDFEYDAVKRFADWREDKAVVYVSNHAPVVIGKLYDGRIGSRVTCGTIFKLDGPDRRLTTKSEVDQYTEP